MIKIRLAKEPDVDGIREIFLATYGQEYAYPQYYNVDLLKKMVFSDDTLLIVAEEIATGRIVGTASVLMQMGAFADLVGEFGRLAVHPDAQGQGIGKLLMEGRIERVQERLHVGLVEPRVTHSYSQKISARFGFANVGFLPMNLLMQRRESAALCVRYFGDSLALRRNNPRVIPDVYPLAELALQNCGLTCDAIVDETSPAFVHSEDFELDELTTEGYATLLRIERGRVKQRDIFGPMRLHYGLFKLQAQRSYYLLARQHGHVVGAVGFTIDTVEKAVRVFELISMTDQPIHFLFRELLRRCQDPWGVEYVEVDVSAYAPAMQRTLLGLNFLPVAYVPAMVFHDVERLDSIKMVRLLVPLDIGEADLIDANRAVADRVLEKFRQRSVLPRIEEAVPKMSLFAGLSHEQATRVAGVCGLRKFIAGQHLLQENQCDCEMYLVLQGQIRISVSQLDQVVGDIGPGECLGELSLLCAEPHSATATAATDVEAAVLTHDDFKELARLRPDIGAIVYRNLATGLGEKLRRLDQRVAEQH